MAAAGSLLQRVLELKERLGQAQDPKKVIKALKALQGLDISLDILAETGVGKTVNSFRKHATAGTIAKSLVSHWKKLIPPETESDYSEKKQVTKKVKDERESSISKEDKHSEKSKASESSLRDSKKSPKLDKPKKEHSSAETEHRNKESETPNGCERKIHSSHSSKNTSQGINPKDKKSDCKETVPSASKKTLEKHHSAVADKDSPSKEEKPSTDASKHRNLEYAGNLKENLMTESKTKVPGDEDFEPPTMSFESYLTYDQVSKNRKRKACPKIVQPKIIKCCDKNNRAQNSQQSSKFPVTKEDEEKPQQAEDDQSETPAKKAKTASLQDLLNTPLPKFLPEISISSPPYATDFKASITPATEVPEQNSDTSQFTGRRLNSKMQVYSGSKTVHLSKMLTLYEQCIRVLQNNIDSLHEVGGVPFEILEPVLTRCTPEQLFRIEECNPIFTEESDHLWKRHCQRDFKNDQLLEYESWREMYLRLFNQREEKLKTLTKNILSAQSEKPKGRQVKMAYVNSVAKPPRNIRRQQEIYGTAGPIQLHPTEKGKLKNPESRDRNSTLLSLNSASSSVTPGCSSACSSGVNPDVKKHIKKVAPMMRKTLRAFKNRVGPR